MQQAFTRLIVALLIAVWASGNSSIGNAESTSNEVSSLQAALADLDQWIGDEANGQKWRKFLATAALQKQIAAGSGADPAVVSQVLAKYRSGALGLEKPRFVKVRQEIDQWLTALRGQYANDLAKMAWASRGDYNPAAIAGRLPALRTELRTTAQQLEQKLGTSSELAQGWKRYLKWELLELHFNDAVKVRGESLANLDVVLKRFRSNRPGLEHPAFLETAAALSSYRDMVAWHEKVRQVAKRSRKKRSLASVELRTYTMQLLGLKKALTQHQEEATVETTRKIAETLGLIETLQQSPQLVAAMRKRYAQPNLLTSVSEEAIRQLAQRPVQDTQPVRDVILGAQIRGTAVSTGFLTLETFSATDHIEIEAQIAGNIHSNTTGYKKPVVITSQGNTSFVSTKRLLLSDGQFLLLPACTSANTKNQVCSIHKTGGQFARQLIERIAWKQVKKKKSQSQAIASQHAEQKISKKFNQQIGEAISQARQKYDEKVRAALIRTGMFPQELNFASTDSSIHIEARLASYEQVSTDQAAVELPSNNDFSIQIHETAINNFLPTLLGGLAVQQNSEDAPPQLTGNALPWLKKLVKKKSEERQTTPDASSDESDEEVASDFKPFSILLDHAYPLSVSFDGQQLNVRIRVAEMKTIEEGEETIRTGWDFLVSYAIVQDGNQVTLNRVGEVEAFPTGFDPRWDAKLTSEQVATRGALTKILKNRSKQGKGFPEKIVLPELEIPRPEKANLIPILQHLESGNGWLTIGYQLP